MLCGSYVKIWNLVNHLKKWNKKYWTARFVDENWKIRVWSSIFWSSCDLQDFKFWYVNRKAFSATFLYWADFIQFCIKWPFFTETGKSWKWQKSKNQHFSYWNWSRLWGHVWSIESSLFIPILDWEVRYMPICSPSSVHTFQIQRTGSEKKEKEMNIIS